MFADAVVNGVLDGEAEPLEIRTRIDAIEKIIKAVKAHPDFQAEVLDQAERWPEKSFEHNGVTFTKSESAKYDYSDDPTWATLKKAEDACADHRKEREALLKALKEATEIDGVLCHPPVKRSTSYVKITF